MNWLKKFMSGRYGVDHLSNFLLIISIILMTIGTFTELRLLNSIAYATLLLSYLRIFSKNVYKRYDENQKFLRFWNPIKLKFSGIITRIKHFRTHKYFKCTSCGKSLRVPRGKGRINVTCPHCHTKFEART